MWSGFAILGILSNLNWHTNLAYFYVLGKGIGSIISGQVVAAFGMRNMFFIFAGFALGLFILYTSLQCYLKRIPISSQEVKSSQEIGMELHGVVTQDQNDKENRKEYTYITCN